MNTAGIFESILIELVRHIKHPAPRLAKDRNNGAFDVHVTQRSNHISTIKRVQKRLHEIEKGKMKRITCVKTLAMGRLIKKALAVGLEFQNKGHQVEILTGTVTVMDEFDENPDEEPKIQPRKVSKVEVKIYPKSNK